MAGAENLRYPCDGLTEDVVVELARFRGLFDVARTEDGSRPRRETAEFGLAGAVRRVGDRVRVSVGLEGLDGVELWSERFEWPADDVLSAQADLARAVAAATAGRIVAVGVDRARGRSVTTLAPFDALVLGLDLLNRYEAEAHAQARALLGHVLDLDPSSARATAGLASSWLYDWMVRPGPAALARAYDQARAALALDSADAWCHMVVGRVHLVAQRFDLADHFYDRAARLNPSDTDVMASHGIALAYLGRPVDGIARVQEARRLNPYHPTWHDENLGFALLVARRYADAVTVFERMDQAPSWVHCARAVALHHLGRSDAARAAIAQALAADPSERISVYAATEPFRDPADLEHFLDGLRGAGLPD